MLNWKPLPLGERGVICCQFDAKCLGLWRVWNYSVKKKINFIFGFMVTTCYPCTNWGQMQKSMGRIWTNDRTNKFCACKFKVDRKILIYSIYKQTKAYIYLTTILNRHRHFLPKCLSRHSEINRIFKNICPIKKIFLQEKTSSQIFFGTFHYLLILKRHIAFYLF